MTKPHARIWDGSYVPTVEELEEPLAPPLEVLNRTVDENVEHLMNFRPPADATWPDDG